MILRLFFLLLGFGLAVAGGVTIVAYLNLLTTGIGFSKYFIFIAQRPELYLFVSGIGIAWLSIYFPIHK